MRHIPSWMALALLAVLVACTQAPAPPPDTSAAAAAALQANSEAFLNAWNAADVATLGDMLAEDAIEMPPDGPVLDGRAAIMQATTDYFSQFTATQTATTDEVNVQGDLAISRGTWTVTETPKAGGETVTRSGKWFDVQKRQADGSWKTWRWMWNQATAPAAM